jgi:hypothetical protein
MKEITEFKVNLKKTLYACIGFLGCAIFITTLYKYLTSDKNKMKENNIKTEKPQNSENHIDENETQKNPSRFKSVMSGAKSVVAYIPKKAKNAYKNLIAEEEDSDTEISPEMKKLMERESFLKNEYEFQSFMRDFKLAGGLEELEEIEVTTIHRNGDKTTIIVSGIENIANFMKNFFNGENMALRQIIKLKFRHFRMIITDFFRNLFSKKNTTEPTIPESTRSNANLEERSNDVHNEMKKLAIIYDEIQQNMERIFDNLFLKKAHERELILKNIDLLIQRKKTKVGAWDKLKDFFKSEDNLKRKSGDGTLQNERMVAKDEIVDYELVSRISSIEALIKEYTINTEEKIILLKELHQSYKQHLENYNIKRQEFISLGRIKDNEGIFKYKSPNYSLFKEEVEKFLEAVEDLEKEIKETSERRNNSNSKRTPQPQSQNLISDSPIFQSVTKLYANEISKIDKINDRYKTHIKIQDIEMFTNVASRLSSYYEESKSIESLNSLLLGFVDVIEALIDQMRSVSLNERNQTFVQTFDDEARFLNSFKKICKENFFSQFYELLTTQIKPAGYKKNSQPFMFSFEMIRACKAYLNSNDVVFGTSSKSIKKAVKNSNVKIVQEATSIMHQTVNDNPKKPPIENTHNNPRTSSSVIIEDITESTQPSTSRGAAS